MKFSLSHAYFLSFAIPSVLSATLPVTPRSVDENLATLGQLRDSLSELSSAITDDTREAIAKDPILMDLLAAGESKTERRTEALALYPRVDVGLPRNQWVTVPVTCAACIIACMTSNPGNTYTAGSTIHDVIAASAASSALLAQVRKPELGKPSSHTISP
ncbi:hypothetical protein F5B20DRAFT_593942 [Whalleya microplaca]|nr:hypothetical protein F5B20DRAFT_593942 [Whalleya microplaca]